jgi:hypothetical protein
MLKRHLPPLRVASHSACVASRDQADAELGSLNLRIKAERRGDD